MRNKILLALVVGILAFTLPVFSQVSTKTGSIYGKTVDDKGAPLPGVSITLESNEIPTQTATSGPSGGFRFANLPPGVYSVNFSIEGFTEVRQEEVRVSTGSQVQLEITMKPSLAEEFTVIGETPVVDTKKTGTSNTSTVIIWKMYQVRVIHGPSLIKQLVSIRIVTMLPVLNQASKHRSSHVAEVMTTRFGTTMV